MKRIVILFLIILLQTTTSFSQIIWNDSVIGITPIQLKTTNLIFVEHEKLLKENSLLKIQLDNYVKDNQLLTQTDSIKTIQLKGYKDLDTQNKKQIEQLNKDLSRKKKELTVWKIGGLGISVGLLLWLLVN